MSANSSLSSIVRAGLPLGRTAAGRAGPSRFISSSTPNPNRPTPAQSLGSIFEETWGPNSSAALGLSKADEKDIKADLRAAGLSPSIADVPKKVDVQGQTQGRTLYRPGYAAETRPPRVDPLLDLFTNLLMKHGRKAEAQKRIGEVLDVIRQTTLSDPVPLMHQAIHLTSPSIRIVSLRRAAKNVPIPSALDARQRARTGISWILKAAEKGRKGGASERTGRIAKEVLAVLDGSSAALARKDEVHRLGAVNRSNLTTR